MSLSIAQSQLRNLNKRTKRERTGRKTIKKKNARRTKKKLKKTLKGTNNSQHQKIQKMLDRYCEPDITTTTNQEERNDVAYSLASYQKEQRQTQRHYAEKNLEFILNEKEVTKTSKNRKKAARRALRRLKEEKK